MKKIEEPKPIDWDALCVRPTLDNSELTGIVEAILEEVQKNGDRALQKLAEKYDGARLNDIQVCTEEISKAGSFVDSDLKKAIELAKSNIEQFHNSQREDFKPVETAPGVLCWRKNKAIQKVGLYIPGGSAPLFSTVLMLGIPAKIAGCEEVIMCTPPREDGTIDPVILYTAELVGITKIFKIGGAQAVAAMAFGTESVPRVYKIFGPGNQFVTKAKELIQQTGTAIDMPAGPSEVLVVADETCDPAFVAADLLSQAEHGADSQVILVSTSEDIIDTVNQEIDLQLDLLPRKSIAEKALQKSFSIRFDSMKKCLEFSNCYAPEHLIIASEKAENFINDVQNAGSVFVGNFSCESAGDYASGTNHTLPTNGYARNYSGVSLDSFLRKITFQQLSSEGIQNIGPAIERMAEAEQLFAHKNAVTLRLKSLTNV